MFVFSLKFWRLALTKRVSSEIVLENEQGRTREEGGHNSGILSERNFWMSPVHAYVQWTFIKKYFSQIVLTEMAWWFCFINKLPLSEVWIFLLQRLEYQKDQRLLNSYLQVGDQITLIVWNFKTLSS